jgi:hypothetical protein
MGVGWGDGLAFLSAILILVVGFEVQKVRRELRRVSDSLGAIREKLGIVEPPKAPAEVFGLLQSGRKIEAIKAYREATGAGLAEAKAAVERLAAGSGPDQILHS